MVGSGVVVGAIPFGGCLSSIPPALRGLLVQHPSFFAGLESGNVRVNVHADVNGIPFWGIGRPSDV